MRKKTYQGRLISVGRWLLAPILVVAAPLSCQIVSGLDGLDVQDEAACTRPCYSGPEGTEGIGACKAGTQTCDPAVACEGEVTPKPFDDCGNEKDVSCDGEDPLPCTGAPVKVSLYGGAVEDAGNAVALDSKGNVILVGTYRGEAMFEGVALEPSPVAENNIFVAKLDPSGEVLWAKGFGGPGEETAIALAVGKDDSIAVTGWYTNEMSFGNETLMAEGQVDAFLAKLDAGGSPLWARSFGGPGTHKARAVAVDAMGNVVVTGNYAMGDINLGDIQLIAPYDDTEDGFVAKIGPDGDPLWARAIAGDGVEGGYAIMADSAGDVIVGGQGKGGLIIADAETAGNEGNGALLFKLDGQSGDLRWVKVFGPSSGSPDQVVYDVAPAGDDGEIAIVGQFQGAIAFPPNSALAAAGGLDGFVAKLDKEGSAVWSQAIGGSMADVAYEVGADLFGNIVIAGHFNGTFNIGTTSVQNAGGRDALLVKLRPNGTLLWGHPLGGVGNDAMFGVAVDPRGAAHAIGRVDKLFQHNGMTYSPLGEGDILYVKLAP
jgi:hypothetical protein